MALDVLVTQWISKGLSGFHADLRAAGMSVDTFEGKAERLSRLGDRLSGIGIAGAGGLAALTVGALKAKGDMQLVEIGFSKSLGSMEAAKAKIEELREFDRASPFSFKESVKGAQRLMAVGFAAKDVKSVLTDIGDAAAGTGGTTDDFMGISRAIGQMKSKGKISMEEINQLGDRGINALAILQKELKLTDEQKAEFMNGDFTIKSDVGVDALLKGFRELYGGTMLESSKTLPGQVSNLQSAVFQLGETVGGLQIGPATTLIEKLTGMTDSANEFAKAHPGITKTGLAIGGAGTLAMLAYGQLIKWKGANNLAKLSVDNLAKSVLAENAAERTKIGTLGAETAAFGKSGKASDYSATAAMRLAGANAEAGMKAEAAANRVAKATAKQKAILDKLNPAQRAYVMLQRSSVGQFLGRNALSLPGSAALEKKSLDLAIRSRSGTFGRDMGAMGARLFGNGGALNFGARNISMGGALASGALGIGAGISANNNMKAAGYSEGQAAAYGAITGIGAAGVAAFVPGGAIVVAAGEGMAWAINEFVNKPMEDAAENGPRDKDGNVINTDDMGGTAAEQEKKQWERAHKLAEAGGDDNLAESTSAGIVAKGRRSRAKMLAKEADERELRERSARHQREDAEKAAKDARDEALWGDTTPEVGQVTIGRSGAKKVVFVANMPASPADDTNRRNGYRARTATPNLAY